MHALRAQKTRGLPQGHRGRSVEAKVAIRAPPGSEGPCWRKDASLPAGRRQKGIQCSRVWAELLRECLTSHQEEEKLTARSVFLCVVDFF